MPEIEATNIRGEVIEGSVAVYYDEEIGSENVARTILAITFKASQE